MSATVLSKPEKDFASQPVFVYMAFVPIDGGTKIKIGMSRNPSQRIRALCLMSQDPSLYVSPAFPDSATAYAIEHEILYATRRYRVEGEWLFLPAANLDLIDELFETADRLIKANCGRDASMERWAEAA